MDRSLAYVIDVAKGEVHVTYRAQPSFEQWSEAMRRIFADANYQPNFGILLDRSSLHRAAETEYINRMVRFMDRHLASGECSRWAILICDDASYGMGRMAEQLSDFGSAIRTFRVLAEAEAWLAGSKN